MHDGYRIRLWARQNGYTLERMADELGYPLQALSEALDNNRIGPKLAAALRTRLGLHVISRPAFSREAEAERGAGRDTSIQPPEVGPPSETGGRAGPGARDTHLEEIMRLLDKPRPHHRSD